MSNTTDLVSIPVPGTDRTLMAVEIDGTPQVSLRHTCEAIGLATDSQRRKLRGRSWAVVTQEVATGSDGKSYEMTMIDRRTLTMWLATIDENRVSDDARPVLIAFQAEAADALDAYFHEGGAINPNATEEQLDVLVRRARAQASVLSALRGIVDAKHLEAKGRIILAQAMGEKPEIEPADVPLYVSDFLASKGLNSTLVAAKAPGFGRRLKGLYIAEHGEAPALAYQELPNGTVRQVCAYTESDRDLFEQVWTRHYTDKAAA